MGVEVESPDHNFYVGLRHMAHSPMCDPEVTSDYAIWYATETGVLYNHRETAEWVARYMFVRECMQNNCPWLEGPLVEDIPDTFMWWAA